MSASSSEPRLLTKAEQRSVIRVLQNGGSPLVACLKLDVHLESYDLTREQDASFRQRIERVYQARDENVDSALYRDAIAGNASSQSTYLRSREKRSIAGEPADERLRELSELSVEELLEYQARLKRLGPDAGEGDCA